MTIKELELQLIDDYLVINSHAFRHEKQRSFSTPKEATDFLVKFLVLETTAGVNYSGEELLSAYSQIKEQLVLKGIITSSDLPYHPLKRRPSKEINYLLDGSTCYMK